MRRTALLFALAGLVGALVATPVAVYASHQFTDVPDGNVFHNSIDWMKTNGITVGCNPPANTQYCPGDDVTRGQMAAFMKRLAERQVVDAATAVDSDKVDGWSANELFRVAFDSTEDAPDTNGDAVSATVAAPGDGWLILSGSIDGFGTGAFDAFACTLQVDGNAVAGTVRNAVVHSAGGLHTSHAQEGCSTTGVHPVSAGSHTIALTISKRDVVLLANATVWALYVPFDGLGNTP